MSGENDQEERKFLHDVANPIATAIFVLDGFIEDLGELPDSPNRSMLLEQITSVAESLDQARKHLAERREILIRRSGK